MIEFLKLLTVIFCLSHLSVGIFEKIGNIKLLTYQPFKLIKDIFSCKSCASFWMTIIWTQDIFLASSIWIIVYLYDSLLAPMVEKIRL